MIVKYIIIILLHACNFTTKNLQPIQQRLVTLGGKESSFRTSMAKRNVLGSARNQQAMIVNALEF